MNASRISKLKAVAFHPNTPIGERENAIRLLEKHGIVLEKPKTSRVTAKAPSNVLKKVKLPTLDKTTAKTLIHPWSKYKNDPVWGLGCDGCGFKYLVMDTDGTNKWAFVEYEDALDYAMHMPKLRAENGKHLIAKTIRSVTKTDSKKQKKTHSQLQAF